MESVRNKRKKGMEILKIIDSFYAEGLIGRHEKDDCANMITEFMKSGDIGLMRDMADYLTVKAVHKKPIYRILNQE